VLLVVVNPDPFVWPFLREVFKAMPASLGLRNPLHDTLVLLFKAEELPEHLKVPGAGSGYHIAILSPHGLPPADIQSRARQPRQSRRPNHLSA
jgi:hypothetical protein